MSFIKNIILLTCTKFTLFCHHSPMKNINLILIYSQAIIWFLTFGSIILLIFIWNSPNWGIVSRIGFAFQLTGVGVLTFSSINKLNAYIKWRTYIIAVCSILFFFYLINSGIVFKEFFRGD